MGQYYKIINVDKKELLAPWDFDHGAKLMEWSYQGRYIVNALYNLLQGSWKGDRVYVVGDYADLKGGSENNWQEVLEDISKEFGFFGKKAKEDTEHHTKDDPITLYSYASEFFKNISEEVVCEGIAPGVRYIFNNKLKQYIDLANIPVNYERFNSLEGINRHTYICPLTLLLTMGNGRGGGDYKEKYPGYSEVGSWCKTSQYIEVSNALIHPEYEEYDVPFTTDEVEVKKPFEAAMFTWKELSANAIGEHAQSKRLKAKKNAKEILRALIMLSMGHDINELESPEGEIERWLDAFPDTVYFDSKGNLLRIEKEGKK